MCHRIWRRRRSVGLTRRRSRRVRALKASDRARADPAHCQARDAQARKAAIGFEIARSSCRTPKQATHRALAFEEEGCKGGRVIEGHVRVSVRGRWGRGGSEVGVRGGLPRPTACYAPRDGAVLRDGRPARRPTASPRGIRGARALLPPQTPRPTLPTGTAFPVNPSARQGAAPDFPSLPQRARCPGHLAPSSRRWCAGVRALRHPPLTAAPTDPQFLPIPPHRPSPRRPLD